ncbi:hypothetical protein [Candidatus Marinarcus aquaticus]|uniref:Uncharacterized protein n=1 Tax=Candidatus Marinarcus aquaticus TaxID=2044504 RepID=A0A4Q0XRR5_9BACT|nr:hypothetical protein [Candidatus Marinarcus aquaticus]RXJ57975.1 hypothetical protein CRV04_05575 [Candidatus Marinarcus aquaticus]
MKKLFYLFCTFIMSLTLYAHTLVLNLDDNEDGTLFIQGMFNTGESAEGALVIVESLDNQEVLFKKRLPSSSELIVPMPKVAYHVVLDGGPGHTVIKEGIEPIGGFKVEEKKETKKQKAPNRANMQISNSPAVTISIVIAFTLLIATIVISIFNTNRLMRELKKGY